MLGAGSGLPITPKGGSGRGSVRRGGSLEMKGGAHEAPRYHCKQVVLQQRRGEGLDAEN